MGRRAQITPADLGTIPQWLRDKPRGATEMGRASFSPRWRMLCRILRYSNKLGRWAKGFTVDERRTIRTRRKAIEVGEILCLPKSFSSDLLV